MKFVIVTVENALYTDCGFITHHILKRPKMPTYVEYQLDENTTILIELAKDEVSGVIRASREPGDVARVKAKMSFLEALKNIRAQAKLLLHEIEDLHVEEAEVKFGINTVGELGIMAIGKVGGGGKL